jgi:hypothetical protein
MKKIIVAVITGFVFASVGYAQNSHLDSRFNQIARQDGFTYVYMGKGYSELKISEDLTKEFKSITFVKVLSNGKPNSKEVKNTIRSVKFSLNSEDFELILKIVQDDFDKTEIYLKKSKKNELEKVIIIETSEGVSVTWIYGEGK